MLRIGRFLLLPDLLYTPDHTWGKVTFDGNVKVGMDDFIQKMTGLIVRVRVFPAGHSVKQFKPFGTIESLKWTGSLISPFSGTIEEVNQQVKSNPKLIHSDPYEKGWIVVISPTIDRDAEKSKLITGERAVDWLKKDIKEIAKESY